MNLGRTAPGGVLCVDHSGQRLVVHVDQAQRLFGDVPVHRRDGRHRGADLLEDGVGRFDDVEKRMAEIEKE